MLVDADCPKPRWGTFFRNPIVADNYHEPKIVSKGCEWAEFRPKMKPPGRRIGDQGACVKPMAATSKPKIHQPKPLLRPKPVRRSAPHLHRPPECHTRRKLKEGPRRKNGPHSWQRNLTGVRADPGPRSSARATTRTSSNQCSVCGQDFPHRIVSCRVGHARSGHLRSISAILRSLVFQRIPKKAGRAAGFRRGDKKLDAIRPVSTEQVVIRTAAGAAVPTYRRSRWRNPRRRAHGHGDRLLELSLDECRRTFIGETHTENRNGAPGYRPAGHT